MRHHRRELGGVFPRPRLRRRGLGSRTRLGGAAARLRRQRPAAASRRRSEEHTSELQSLMRISYAVFCLKKKKSYTDNAHNNPQHQQITGKHPYYIKAKKA